MQLTVYFYWAALLWTIKSQGFWVEVIYYFQSIFQKNNPDSSGENELGEVIGQESTARFLVRGIEKNRIENHWKYRHLGSVINKLYSKQVSEVQE